MFERNRWNPFDDMLNLHRNMERIFDRVWNDLPVRTAQAPTSFNVSTSDDAWRLEVPMAGIDPQDVQIEVTGSTLSIRAHNGGEKDQARYRFEQTLTLPQFLDVDKISASHRHGMLELTVPLKESVKPRRIQIQNVDGDRKQLNAAA